MTRFGSQRHRMNNHTEFVCFIWISEKTANFAYQKIKRLVFITEVKGVYCAVRAESLYKTDKFRLSKVKFSRNYRRKHLFKCV